MSSFSPLSCLHSRYVHPACAWSSFSRTWFRRHFVFFSSPTPLAHSIVLLSWRLSSCVFAPLSHSILCCCNGSGSRRCRNSSSNRQSEQLRCYPTFRCWCWSSCGDVKRMKEKADNAARGSSGGGAWVRPTGAVLPLRLW